MKMRLFLSAALLVSGLAALGQDQATQDWAKAQLDKSPRHREWVDVKNGERKVRCFVVYPEVKDPAPVVIVIHEIFGLTAWARHAADEIAAAGYIAIAPDLLSGMGPNGQGSEAFPHTDDAMTAIRDLPPDQITGDLKAVADFAKTLPAANGTLAAAGFCWGGGQTFRFAANQPDLKAAFVFYGPPPAADAMKEIHCPVYGFYGGKDGRITLTVPKTKKEMKADGKKYEPVVYEGAGHGFMRAGEQPSADEANRKAHDEAWERFKALLKKL
jgi:carboxymethylenebutenolidase